MSYLKNVVKKIKRLSFRLFKKVFITTKKEDLSDKTLESKLREAVHIVEKGFVEEDSKILTLIRARELFFEAKKRNLLSESEINWCKKILFGSKTKNKSVGGKSDNSIYGVIKERRSIRSWKDTKLEKEVFHKLIDAARYAPSSCNRQPWYFIVTKDKEKIKYLSNVRGQNFVRNSPYIMLVLIDKEAYPPSEKFRHTSRLDAGAAIQNILLMGENLGLGMCWVNLNISKEKKRKIKSKFEIPDRLDVISMITLGETDEALSPPARKDVKNILHFDKFEYD